MVLLFTIVLGFYLAGPVASRVSYDVPLPFYDSTITDDFDWKLLKELSTSHKNVLVSPISLKLILGLLYQGATSQTEKEFQTVLKYHNKEAVKQNYSKVLNSLKTTDRTEYLLNIGTSIFVDKHLHVRPEFIRVAGQSFHTDLKLTDFSKPEEASKIINNWIEQLTHGKVDKIVNANDLMHTLMIITNAIYFKGTWTHQFPKDDTYFGDFYDSKKAPKNVEYMTTSDEFMYYEDPSLDAKVIRLEYKGSSYAMFIVLPNSIEGLENLIKNVNTSKIAEIRFQMSLQDVKVTLPKFKFNFETKLAETLQKFGLHEMFQSTACFPGIIVNNTGTIRVSDVVQKTGIEVDEEGSVVFSATEFNVDNKFGEIKMVFNASHPFMFFIEGPLSTILFVGKYEDPVEIEVVNWANRLNDDKKPSSNANTPQHYQPPPANTAQHYQPPPANSNQVPTTPDRFQSNDEPTKVQNLPVPNLSPNLDPDAFQAEVDMEDITYRFNLFDIELLNAFSDSPTNVLISPASIKTTLAMILEGATGTCADEISEALRIPDINQQGIRSILIDLLNNLNEKATSDTFLESENAIFTSNKEQLLDSYKNVARQYYKAYLNSLDFTNTDQAANAINKWVEQATHRAISEVISPQMISPETYIIIMNALYFKGKWKVAFDQRGTSWKCFHTITKGCTNVQMMHITDNFSYNYINALRAYAVDIPYQDKFSMLLILPSPDANVRTVTRDLLHIRLTEILDMLNRSEIVLELPKFAFEYSTDLVEYLKPLRIRDVFSSRANLSKIVKGRNALVNNMMHKTKIEVDEVGTTAAASTSAMIIPLMQPVTVSADRPFIFMIYHQETRNIIFEGIVQNPLEKSNANFFNEQANSFQVPKRNLRSQEYRF